MSDAIKRALRTFAQGSVGVALLLLIPYLQGIIDAVVRGGDIEIDGDALYKIGVAIAAGGVIALVSWLQNFIEDKSGKSVLK